MTETLKPCPFCGGGQLPGGYNDYGGLVTICDNCDAEGPPASERSAPAMVEAWNTRADLPPTLAQALAVPEVAALVEAVDREIAARQKWEMTPTDRGGRYGPKGAALAQWIDAIATLMAALAAIRGAKE